jgi:hypothetical protein
MPEGCVAVVREKIFSSGGEGKANGRFSRPYDVMYYYTTFQGKQAIFFYRFPEVRSYIGKTTLSGE